MKRCVFITLGASLLLLIGCSDKPSAPAKSNGGAIVPVIVAQAFATNMPVQVREIGTVEAISSVTIRSQLTGQITKVHFKDGQDVQQGELLYSLDARPSEAALHQAQANLSRDEAQLVSAKLEFDRQKKLLESNIASRDDYDKAEAAFHALEATVMADRAAIVTTELNLEYCSIRAPITGRAGSSFVKEGNIVKSPDDRLVVINQMDPIYVTFSVPQQDLVVIRERMQGKALPVVARRTHDSTLLPTATVPAEGELTVIDNMVDPTTGRVQLKGTFPNPQRALWPGEFVETTLTVGILEQATVVPAQAVQTSQSGQFVFVIGPDDTAQKRPVTPGLSNAGLTVIQSGVKAGETVVTDGQLRLAEGSKVKTQATGAAAAPQPTGEKAS